ncbi:zinc finger BED domain-containing protein RICESLEEPER 2-like [Primulina eburnea]|uniref:zinc finger BED domain-containing protein RICESLEEPER 2-like n=1 Tax=Primulina eburnea TaxID=1245227 RepID=UPI003C6C526C
MVKFHDVGQMIIDHDGNMRCMDCICLSAHFVDDDWKLNSKILSFVHMPPPHSGVKLASKLFGFLKECRIEKKVFSLTLDNASSNDNMQGILKERLSLHDSLMHDGEFFHIRCSAHILNLIVQEGLKIASVALNKIRKSIKYVKGSECMMRKFEECVRAVCNIDSGIGLRSDVPTRWNSTYLMLDSAIEHKKAFSSLQLNDNNYKYGPSIEEWKTREKICGFLEPFYDTNNLISGSSYHTSNLYFMQVWKIEVLLNEKLSNEDLVVSDMCKMMKEKFDKYWNQYSVVLAFGAILDPQIKFKMLDFFYSKLDDDPIKCQEKMLIVKTKLYKLFEQYSNTNHTSYSQPRSSSVAISHIQSGGEIKNKGKRIYDEIMAYESQTIRSTRKSELDLYLEEQKL